MYHQRHHPVPAAIQVGEPVIQPICRLNSLVIIRPDVYLLELIFFFFRMNKTLSPTGGTWVIFVFRYILLVKGNEGRGENDPLGNRKRVTGCDVQ